MIILGIDIKENKKTIKKYTEKIKIPFPILLDTKGKVALEYGIRGTPAHFLIDQNGDIKAFALGYKNWKNTESQDLIKFMIDQNI